MLSPKEAPFWGFPDELNAPYYTKHQQSLNDIHDKLYKQEDRLPLTITGIKGIGKSREAYEYADRHRKFYQWILWIDASSMNTLHMSCQKIIDQWGPQNSELAAADNYFFIDYIKQWLRIMHDSQHLRQGGLLILDGYDYRDKGNPSNQKLHDLVTELISLCRQSYVLLTTDTGKGHLPPHTKYLEIKNWTEEEGAFFLLRRIKKIELHFTRSSWNLASRVLGYLYHSWMHSEDTEVLQRSIGILKQATEKEWNIARSISRELKHFPLALEFAGAYIAKDSNLEEYLHLYREKRATMLWGRVDKSSNPYKKEIATTWEVYFDRIKKENPAAGELLDFCAYFAFEPIPEEVIYSATDLGTHLKEVKRDKLKMIEAISLLSSFSLIKRDAETHTLTVPGIVQTVIQGGIYGQNRTDAIKTEEEYKNEEIEVKRRGVKRAILAVNAAMKQGLRIENSQDRQRIQMYLPHAEECAAFIEELKRESGRDPSYIESIAAFELLTFTGQYLQAFARYKDAEHMLKHAGTICTNLLNGGQLKQPSSEQAEFLRFQAELYHTLGQYERSSNLYDQSLEIYQALGDDAGKAVAQNGSADKLTIDHERENIEAGQATVQNSLGRLFDDWAEIAENEQTTTTCCESSIKYYQEAEKINHQLWLNRQDIDSLYALLLTRSNLAWCYYRQSKDQEAKQLLETIMNDFQLMLNTSSLYIKESSDILQQTTTDWRIYRQIFQGILNVFESNFTGSATPQLYIAQCNMHLGVLNTLHKQYSEAQEYFITASSICDQYFGYNCNHPDIARRLNNQAV